MDPQLLLQPFDGHGPYVWGSLLMCALAIALELLALRARRRAALQALREDSSALPTTASADDGAHSLTPPRGAPVLTRMPARVASGGVERHAEVGTP